MPANQVASSSVALDCSCQVRRTADGGIALLPKCTPHANNPASLARKVIAGGMAARCEQTSSAQTTSSTTTQTSQSTFSYSGNPGASALDQVRFFLGDTNSRAPYLQDGEIDWLLCDASGDTLSAAIRGCETIIAKLSGARDESVGSVSISFSQSAQGFGRLLKTLQMRMGKRALPFAGGINRAQKYRDRADPTMVRPAFTRDMMERHRPWGEWEFATGPYPVSPNWGGGAGVDWTCPPALSPWGTGTCPGETAPVTPATVGDRLLEGPTDPDPSTPGLPGDYWLNTTSGVLFGPYGATDNATLPSGVVDTGVRILTGEQDPTNQTAGVAGEYFLNAETETLFGPYNATTNSTGGM